MPIKLFITGSVGAGKTTLAKRLSRMLDIPLYEGDCVAWEQTARGRVKRSGEKQAELICEIDKAGSWIIEGTPRQSQACLYDLAQRVLFLDTPLSVRRRRIVTRFIRQKLGLETSRYRPDLKMLRMMFKWTKSFEQNRSEFEAMLSARRDKLIVIRNARIPDAQLREIAGIPEISEDKGGKRADASSEQQRKTKLEEYR